MRRSQEREPGKPPQQPSEGGGNTVCVCGGDLGEGEGPDPLPPSLHSPTLTLPPAGDRLARGAADVNTALLKTSLSSGENGGRKKRGEEKRENMRL